MHDETLDRVRAARYLITGTPPLYLKGTVSPGWESYRFASFENPHEAEKMKKLKEHMWIYEKILRRPFTPVKKNKLYMKPYKALRLMPPATMEKK